MKQSSPRRVSMFGLGVLALATSVASADPPPNGGPPGGGGERRGPPQAAFDACSSLSEGASCSVQTPMRTLQGTCVAFPQRGLVCRPAGMGGPPPQR
jgi:hypothetical protein